MIFPPLFLTIPKTTDPFTCLTRAFSASKLLYTVHGHTHKNNFNIYTNSLGFPLNLLITPNPQHYHRTLTQQLCSFRATSATLTRIFKKPPHERRALLLNLLFLCYALCWIYQLYSVNSLLYSFYFFFFEWRFFLLFTFFF